MEKYVLILLGKLLAIYYGDYFILLNSAVKFSLVMTELAIKLLVSTVLV